MATNTYSFDDVLVLLDGIGITEYETGDGISISLADDDTVATQGTHGLVTFAHKPNNIAEITLKIAQASEINDYLDEKVREILRARRGSLSLSVVDGRGQSLFVANQVVPKKRPDMAFAIEPGSREWVFTAAVDRYQIGGNESA